MNKNTLSEIALYHGDIAMPKNFKIDRDKLSTDILQSDITDSPFPFSRNWDMLNTYMRDHFNFNYGRTLVNKSTWGNIYKPNEISIPLLNIIQKITLKDLKFPIMVKINILIILKTFHK